MIVGSFPLQSGRLPLTPVLQRRAEATHHDVPVVPSPSVGTFRPETMNVPGIPDFSTGLL